MERPGVSIAVVAVVPMVLVAVDPSGWYPFGPIKWLLVSVLVPAAAALLWWARPARASRAVTVASLALVAWMAVAAWGGLDPLYAWTGTPERHLGVVTWALCALALAVGQSLDVEVDRAALVGALLAAGAGVGGLACAEALGWEPAVFAVTAGRLTASMGSAAYLGAVAVLLLPAAVGVALDRAFGRRLRLVGALVAAMLAVTTIGSGARAAWLGLVAAGVVVVVARRSEILSSRRQVIASAVAVAIVVAALVAFTSVGTRLESLTDSRAPGGVSRIDEWRVATRVIAEHPVLGVGPEGYRVAFAEGADDTYERAHGRDPLPDRAHSAPLDVAVTGGLPALAAWATIVVLMMAAAWRAVRRGRRWTAGLAAGVIAHFVGQLLLFPTSEIEPVAWLLAGVVLASAATGDAVRSRTVPRVAALALTAIGVAALAIGVVDLRADHHARLAADAAAEGDGSTAVSEARAAVDLRPDEVRLHLLLAKLLVADQQGTAPALVAVNDAARVSPGDPVVLRQRAELLVSRAASTHLPVDIARARRELEHLTTNDPSNSALQLLAGSARRISGDATGAERAFRRAEYLAPRDPAASIALGQLYLDTGRPAEALAAAQRALRRDPGNATALEMRRQARATR